MSRMKTDFHGFFDYYLSVTSLALCEKKDAEGASPSPRLLRDKLCETIGRG